MISLASTITAALDAWGDANMRVARTARVVSASADGKTYTVQPDVAERVHSRGETTWELPPQIPGVPVVWLGATSRAGFCTLLAKDDRVLCLVRDVDHGDVDADHSDTGEPTSGRRCDWSDAVILGGLPTGEQPSASLPSSSHDAVIYLSESDGTVLISGNSASVELARADKVKQELDAIKAAFSQHTHAISGVAVTGGSNGGGPVTGGTANGETGPSSAYSPNNVGTPRVKVDK